MSPSLPPQETFESVFSLQGPVEPDHKNHITSSFSVLDIMNNTSVGNLDIYATRSQQKRTVFRKKSTAQPEMYKKHMSCFSLADIGGGGGDLGHDLALSPTYQENHHSLARDSSTVLTNSRAANRLGGSSDNPSTTAEKPPTSIYSHSLLEPIHVPVTRLPDNWSNYQETRFISRPSGRDLA